MALFSRKESEDSLLQSSVEIQDGHTGEVETMEFGDYLAKLRAEEKAKRLRSRRRHRIPKLSTVFSAKRGESRPPAEISGKPTSPPAAGTSLPAHQR